MADDPHPLDYESPGGRRARRERIAKRVQLAVLLTLLVAVLYFLPKVLMLVYLLWTGGKGMIG